MTVIIANETGFFSTSGTCAPVFIYDYQCHGIWIKWNKTSIEFDTKIAIVEI